MTRRALFRADASPQLGGGHIRRCLVLAEALQLAGWNCTFAVASGSGAVVPPLMHSGHAVIEFAAGDADGIGVQAGGGFDLAVIDHYGLDARFESPCRRFANRILVIDDLANRPHDCDLLVDPTLGRREEDYRPLLAGTAELLLGPAFALLERRFFARRLMLHDHNEQVGHVFVSFGSVDSADLSGKAVTACRMAAQSIEIDVAVGAASPNVASLQGSAADERAPAHIVVDCDDMPALMGAADMAIGAAGGTGWERCCLGLPSLIVTMADNQRENAAALQRAGAAHWLGEAAAVSTGALAAAVARMIEDDAGRRAMRAAALGITDGLGANRVVAAIEGPLAAKDGARVSLRPVRGEDCDLMFAWQTAPGARRYSRNPRPPEPAEHQAWFRHKLADPKCVFNIVRHDGEPAGVLRYDWREGEQGFEVSILIAPERQGQGIASAALALGRRLLPDTRTIAVVDPANRASAALFERAGFARADANRYVLAAGASAGANEAQRLVSGARH